MLPLPNIEFDLPDMEKSGLVQKISPEEIKMGDKLIGVIQLTTEIAVLCIFQQLDDQERALLAFYYPPLNQNGNGNFSEDESNNNATPSLANKDTTIDFNKRRGELSTKYYSKFTAVFYKLQELLTLYTEASKAKQNTSAKIPANMDELLAHFKELFSLPGNIYDALYRFNPDLFSGSSNKKIDENTPKIKVAESAPTESGVAALSQMKYTLPSSPAVVQRKSKPQLKGKRTLH